MNNNIICVGMDVHKSHFNLCCFDFETENFFCEVETKDSFRRSLLPILQSALINHITYSGKDLIQIMNNKCYNSFFQSLVITLNKEAIPKKAKKCDIKALKSYIIEQITERTAAELEELITKVLNEFN